MRSFLFHKFQKQCFLERYLVSDNLCFNIKIERKAVWQSRDIVAISTGNMRLRNCCTPTYLGWI